MRAKAHGKKPRGNKVSAHSSFIQSAIYKNACYEYSWHFTDVQFQDNLWSPKDYARCNAKEQNASPSCWLRTFMPSLLMKITGYILCWKEASQVTKLHPYLILWCLEDWNRRVSLDHFKTSSIHEASEKETIDKTTTHTHTSWCLTLVQKSWYLTFT
jgi:hypothetical protein